MVGARVLAVVLTTWMAAGAIASAQSVESELRAAGRSALREGRFEDALSAFQQAAFQSRDPNAWLEVADAADRLRDDVAALDAYSRYLAARPNAPDRVEIVARVEILQRVTAERPSTPIGEAHRRGLMATRPDGQAPSRAGLGEVGRRGIIPAAEIVAAIRRGSHAGRELAAPRH